MAESRIREVSELDTGKFGGEVTGLPLIAAIAAMRDEVTVLNMARHRGNSRELAMAIAKLDEARLWAVAYGEAIGSHVVIPRAEILREAISDV